MTASTFRKAYALAARNDAKRRTIERLKALVDAARVVDYANTGLRIDATMFRPRPDRLAGAVALYRRTDPATRAEILKRYHELLADMLESPMAGIKPHKVDFAALHVDARPYLLAPYLGLVVGTYPRLDFDQSDPPLTLTYTHTGGPADVAVWKPLLPKISAWLGGNYHLTASTATTVTLTRRADLPREIPMNPAWLLPGHLFLGIDVASHRPYHVPLDTMTHTLIAGTPGMGKSVFLHLLLRSCLHSIGQFEHIYAICGQGIAFERYRGLHPKLTVNNEPEHFYTLAERLQTTMQERTARLVAEKRDKMGEYILVLVDEWGAFNNPEGTDKASTDAHKVFLKHITNIGKRGRKNGLRLMFVVQEPVDRDLASGVRSSLSSILSFRLPLGAHGQSLFGEITPPAVPTDVRTLPVGRAIFHNGITGTRTLIQIPVTDPPRGRP